MKEMTLQEHVTALFVLAMCEYYLGQEDNAKHTVLVAAQIVERSHLAVA